MLEQVFRPQATPYRDDQFRVTGSADATKLFKLEVDTQATGSTLTLDVGAQTTSRTATIPALTTSDTFAFLGVANVFTQQNTVDLGSGSDTTVLSGVVPQLLLRGADSTPVRIVSRGWSAASGAWLSTAIGGTRATPAATPDGTFSFQLSTFGYDGSSYSTAANAQYRQVIDGLWSLTNRGVMHTWLGTPNGSTSAAEWARLADACLLIGTTTKMTGVTGGLTLAGTTDSTSTTTGTLQCSGGIGFGVTKSMFGGGIKSTSPTLGIGYATGAGSTVTQATSKATGVTLNTACGTITMNNAALNAGTSVAFTLTNSVIAATDLVIVNIKSGATALSYNTEVEAVAAGSCSICLRNYTAGNLSEAVVLSFAVIKAVAA